MTIYTIELECMMNSLPWRRFALSKYFQISSV